MSIDGCKSPSSFAGAEEETAKFLKHIAAIPGGDELMTTFSALADQMARNSPAFSSSSDRGSSFFTIPEPAGSLFSAGRAFSRPTQFQRPPQTTPGTVGPADFASVSVLLLWNPP